MGSISLAKGLPPEWCLLGPAKGLLSRVVLGSCKRALWKDALEMRKNAWGQQDWL